MRAARTSSAPAGGTSVATGRAFGASTSPSRRRAPRPRRGRASAASTTAATRTCPAAGRSRRPACRRRCPAGRTEPRRLSGVGSGWRPLRPVFGADRSRSRCAKRAPGTWPAAYCSSPQASGCARSWRTSTMARSGCAEARGEVCGRDEGGEHRGIPSGGVQSLVTCGASLRRAPGCSCTAMIPAMTISAIPSHANQGSCVAEEGDAQHAGEHDARVRQRGRHQRLALAVGARHEELPQRAHHADAGEDPQVRPRHRVPGLRRHPDQRAQAGEQREVEHDARFRLLRADELADVPVRDRRDRARGEADDERPELIGVHRRPQQQQHAGEAQQHRADEHAAGPLAREEGQQQGEEQRRAVVERHRRRHRQRGQRVEEHEQRDEARDAAVDVHAEALRLHRAAGVGQYRVGAGHLHQRAVEHQLGGGELLGTELHERAHQRERESGGEHPERLHRGGEGAGAKAVGPVIVPEAPAKQGQTRLSRKQGQTRLSCPNSILTPVCAESRV